MERATYIGTSLGGVEWWAYKKEDIEPMTKTLTEIKMKEIEREEREEKERKNKKGRR